MRNLVPLGELARELARFDINLAPSQVGNPFCESQSEFKFWRAALVDVPTIASPTGPFIRAIREGYTGFLAASREGLVPSAEKTRKRSESLPSGRS